MGIVEILTVVFVVCKILEIGVIASWSWWQVFMPELIVIGIYILIVIVMAWLALRKKFNRYKDGV